MPRLQQAKVNKFDQGEKEQLLIEEVESEEDVCEGVEEELS